MSVLVGLCGEGIGRITGNLPKEHADEIVASVLEVRPPAPLMPSMPCDHTES